MAKSRSVTPPKGSIRPAITIYFWHSEDTPASNCCDTQSCLGHKSKRRLSRSYLLGRDARKRLGTGIGRRPKPRHRARGRGPEPQCGCPGGGAVNGRHGATRFTSGHRGDAVWLPPPLMIPPVLHPCHPQGGLLLPWGRALTRPGCTLGGVGAGGRYRHPLCLPMCPPPGAIAAMYSEANETGGSRL